MNRFNRKDSKHRIRMRENQFCVDGANFPGEAITRRLWDECPLTVLKGVKDVFSADRG